MLYGLACFFFAESDEVIGVRPNVTFDGFKNTSEQFFARDPRYLGIGVVDVDNLLLNVFGAVIGYGFYVILIKKIWNKKMNNA